MNLKKKNISTIYGEIFDILMKSTYLNKVQTCVILNWSTSRIFCKKVVKGLKGIGKGSSNKWESVLGESTTTSNRVWNWSSLFSGIQW